MKIRKGDVFMRCGGLYFCTEMGDFNRGKAVMIDSCHGPYVETWSGKLVEVFVHGYDPWPVVDNVIDNVGDDQW